MGPFFREQSQIEIIGTVTAITWFLGGMFNDKYLYFLSMVLSVGILCVIFVNGFLFRRLSVNLIHTYAFRRLIVSLLASWMYTTGTEGPEKLNFGDASIPINDFAQFVMFGLLILWFATRYSELLDKKNRGFYTSPLAIFRGLLRGLILAGAVIAMFNGRNKEIPSELQTPIFIAYLIEPFIYVLYSQLNRTVSSVDMVVGSSRLPSVALRESFLSNLMLLIITMLFNGVSGDEWSLLRVVYIIGVIFAIISSVDAIKKFNENPLGTGILGQFLNNTPDVMENLDLQEKLGHIIDSPTIVDVGDDSSISISPGSLVVPIEEVKGKVTTMIIGQSENIVTKNKEMVSQSIEGVTTAVIPANKLNSLKRQFTAKQINTIDLSAYGLPSLQTIESVIKSLGFSMNGWIGKVKSELTKFKLSNYGVTEFEGKTTVNLPGIYVNETPDTTHVKVAGLRVYETPQTNTVRIGNFLTVVEFPKMTFVTMPFLTVMEMKGVGTAVNLMGFKISDELSADRLDEFKGAFLKHLDQWEAGIESQLGRIIADPNASAIMSMSWDGEFKPLLEGHKQSFGDHPALESSTASRNLLQESIPQTDSEVKLIELTGLDKQRSKEKREKRVSRKERREMEKLEQLKLLEDVPSERPVPKHVKYDLEIGVGKRKKRVTNIEESSDSKELDEVKASLEKARQEIDEKLQQIDTEMETKTAKTHDIKEIYDAEYEIVDDEEE
jgi:hypothetical protein